jgi:hypothetical protein
MKKISKLVLIIIFVFSLFSFANMAKAGTVDLMGYAWSSNVGWISFNSLNTNAGSGSTYAVHMATTSYTGTLSGYAWSPNIGWISFQTAHVSGCPVPIKENRINRCYAKIDMAKGAITGWARACAGTINGDCTGGSRTDGWDGWIELSGANHTSPYGGGIRYATTTGLFSGYAWGSDVVGWLSFDITGGGGVKCPDCGTGIVVDNLPGLTLEVLDPYTSNWTTSVTINATKDGNASAMVRWNPKIGTTVQTASNDWPEGNNKSISKSGLSFSSVGSETVLFTDIYSATTKVLKLSFLDENNERVNRIVSININPYVGNPNTGSCSPQPANSLLCKHSFTDPPVQTTSVLVGDINSCPANSGNNENSRVYCAYYCPVGLVKNKANTKCVLPSTIQEF